jgi:RimJ/RimL family protein N-acetyltransferase
MHIRPAELIDLERLQAMKAEVASALFLRYGCTPAQITAWLLKQNSAEWWSKMLTDPAVTYLVENGAGGLIGMASISYLDHNTAYLGSLYCRVQNMGVGSMLMRQRLITATEMGVLRCACNVLVENEKARRFVEHYGFTPGEMYIHQNLQRPMVTYLRDPHIDGSSSDK